MAQKTFIINDNVRCFSYGYSASYDSIVTVQKNINQTVQQELVHDPYDWARFSVPINNVKNIDKDDLRQVLMNIGGNQDSFLFRDEFGFIGNQIARNTIGNKPTSATVSLQAIRTYSISGETDRTYEVWNIEMALGFSLWVGGVLKTNVVDYSVNSLDDGTIEITCADTGDVEIEGYFLRRCRINGALKSVLEAFDLNNFNLSIIEEAPRFGV